jgi:sugar lactone lactonase YvrE
MTSAAATGRTEMRDDGPPPAPAVLLDGVVLGESPRWHDGRLWFCDWGRGIVVAVDEAGRWEALDSVPEAPWSIAWRDDGWLLFTSAGRDAGRLVGRDPAGGLHVLADLSAVAAPPWNEIVVDGRGNVFLNAIGFDLMAGAEPRPGVVAVVTPDGTVRQVAGDVEFPNGMAVTPDGSTLIVAESYAHRLTAFDIAPDGSLSGRRVWAALGAGTPDGICLDADGAVWYADVPNRRCVRVQEGGAVLAEVVVDRGCFACMLGGDDGATLFVNAAVWDGPDGMFGGEPSGQVLRAAAPAAHAGRP